MLTKCLAIACIAIASCVALAQLRLPIQTDPKNPVQPIRTLSIGRASVIDTRSFAQQIGPSFPPTHEMPENPTTPAWNEIPGEPNTLQLGGMLPIQRGAPGSRWPAINATGWTP